MRIASHATLGFDTALGKDDSTGHQLINARKESVAEKRSFRDAFKRRRCLIPASGFYEWKQEGKFKQPYYISLKSGESIAFADLWETWKTPDGTSLQSTNLHRHDRRESN